MKETGFSWHGPVRLYGKTKPDIVSSRSAAFDQ